MIYQFKRTCLMYLDLIWISHSLLLVVHLIFFFEVLLEIASFALASAISS